jgi:predicted ATPase
MPCLEFKIFGYRGFATTQHLKLAVPDGTTPGSGLTMIVGPNNSGKSTITEAFRALGTFTPPSFTEGRRNKKAGDRIELCISGQTGTKRIIKSVMAGSSETTITSDGAQMLQERIFSLPARRVFNPYFGKATLSRQNYLNQDALPAMRSQFNERHAWRLFEALAHLDDYNAVLGRILQPVPTWTIDQSDAGQYYVKLISGDVSHSSEGMGEGLVSLLLIVDALYDSGPDDVIVFDEPELSLHPALQRKLSLVFRDFARDRQIICATHSPHFVDFEAIGHGATLARVSLEETGSTIHQLGESSRAAIRSFLSNLNNPHMLGLDAREVFFLEAHRVSTVG